MSRSRVPGPRKVAPPPVDRHRERPALAVRALGVRHHTARDLGEDSDDLSRSAARAGRRVLGVDEERRIDRVRERRRDGEHPNRPNQQRHEPTSPAPIARQQQQREQPRPGSATRTSCGRGEDGEREVRSPRSGHRSSDGFARRYHANRAQQQHRPLDAEQQVHVEPSDSPPRRTSCWESQYFSQACRCRWKPRST